MNQFCRVTISFVITIAAVSSVEAQLSDTQRARLVADMRASAEQLDASRIPDLETAQQDFLRRVAEVQQHLQWSTDPENRDAWLAYFDFDPLIEAIESEASPAVILREASDLQGRLIGTYPGLEVAQVRAVRDAANQLIPAIRYSDRERSVALIGRQLEALATRFEELEAVPSIDDAAASNLILGILEDANQDVPAVRTLRELYGRPNVRLRIGEALVQELVSRNIDEIQPVSDCILGTRITGTAHFVGSAKANLLPANGAVRMQLTVSGRANSNNIGRNGPVRIRSQGFAGLCMTRNITVSESGITFDPSYVDVKLNTKINAIEHRSRLVQRIAWRKARESKNEADRIAIERMRQRLRSDFDRDTQQQASMPADPLAKVRPILQRLELPEPTRELNSTDDAIFLRSVFRRDDQIGSAVSPPPCPTNQHAVLQVHESAVDNALGHLLAGRTVNEREINQLLADVGRSVSEDSEEEPFEIDFASVRPIVFEARDDVLQIGVRCTRFSQGSRELKRSMIISAQYTATSTQDGRVILTRTEKVRISFPGGRRLTMGQAGLRRVIEDNFSDVFPETLLEQPLKIPSDFRLEKVRGREFRTQLITAQDGWLTLAVR